jgi:hypothetical protein
MPTYADVHVRTQLPGWPLAYWGGGSRASAAAEAVGRRVHRYDCLPRILAGWHNPVSRR